MKKFKSTIVLAFALAMVTVLFAHSSLAQAAARETEESSQSCVVDLKHNVHNCQDISGIHVLDVTEVATPGGEINTTCTQSTIQIHVPLNYKATIQFHYDGSPSGWTVNIGDSSTNNGYAGDAATQSNDSEVQILNQQMALYASDYGNNQLLTTINNLGIGAGDTATFVVSNNKLQWTLPNHNGSYTSPYIFALAGQPDAEGPTNNDIYVGVNRVIYGPGSRTGCGVSYVTYVVESIGGGGGGGGCTPLPNGKTLPQPDAPPPCQQ
ncbi:MAG: hypothetical protein KC418_24095 [Anaerolineales bacterium]|nr:hypothetical protein [Anaerolineales bacterium]